MEQEVGRGLEEEHKSSTHTFLLSVFFLRCLALSSPYNQGLTAVHSASYLFFSPPVPCRASVKCSNVLTLAHCLPRSPAMIETSVHKSRHQACSSCEIISDPQQCIKGLQLQLACVRWNWAVCCITHTNTDTLLLTSFEWSRSAAVCPPL